MLTCEDVRTITFYTQPSGSCPAEEFLDGLDAKQARKVAWVMQLVRELPNPSTKFFKKLVGTDLWEIRAEFGGNEFRLLCFFDGETVIVITGGFAKKTDRTPRQEIETALRRMKDYFSRKA